MSIGVCKIDHNKRIVVLQRGPLWQGWGFKDANAFEQAPGTPCYVPELSDTVYTKEDFLRLCDKQEAIARKVFYQLDWQHPEALIEEELREGELTICCNCNRMFESYWTYICPHCGQLNDNT